MRSGLGCQAAEANLVLLFARMEFDDIRRQLVFRSARDRSAGTAKAGVPSPRMRATGLFSWSATRFTRRLRFWSARSSSLKDPLMVTSRYRTRKRAAFVIS